MSDKSRRKTELRILLADDEAIVRGTIGDYLKDLGHEVVEAVDGISALARLEEEEIDLAVLDVRMPGMDGLTLLERIQEAWPDLAVVIATAHGNMEMVIRALRSGAVDFLNKPVRLRELDVVLEKAANVAALKRERSHLRDTIGGIQDATSLRSSSRAMVGESGATEQLRKQIQQAVAARVDTILLCGETGTGKEVVAREIHLAAGSSRSPFIPVNCPAIPESLIESELFGHRKGSFTGAVEHRAGYFELADGGTLFLDEVADLSAAAQAKLLRVLETRMVRRIGDSKEKAVELRVVAASNAALKDRVAKGTFRADLYYRLNVFAIDLLPLRERRLDILPLAEHFLTGYGETRRRRFAGFTDEAADRLSAYDYPGNARELRNIVERAAILTTGGETDDEGREWVDETNLNLPGADGRLAQAPHIGNNALDEERQRIVRALDEHQWNRREAAKAIGMPYSTLRYKIRRYEIG
jgi:two-component system, NtrC family, response regulator AtoC